MRRNNLLILVIALLTWMAAAGMAQETTGAITGKIADPSGGAIVNASVTA